MTEQAKSSENKAHGRQVELQDYVEYDEPYNATHNKKRIEVVGHWLTDKGEELYKTANSDTLLPEDNLNWLPDNEGYENNGFPRKANWQTKEDGLQEGVTILKRRKSDGFVQIETVEEVDGSKIHWVPEDEVTYINEPSAEEALGKKVEDLEGKLSTLQTRLEEMEKLYKKELKAKDKKIKVLEKQLAEAKAGSAGDDTTTNPATPESAPKNPDEEWLKSLLGAPVDYQPSPGRVERDWSLDSAKIIEENGKKYVTLGRTGIRDNFQEKQRVLLDDFKAWIRDSKARESWKPPYGTEWYFNRAKKGKDGTKKPRDWFSWLKRRKGEKPDDEEAVRKTRGYPLGALALGATIGALSVATGALLIEELTDDETNSSANEINIIQNSNQQQNVIVTSEGQMGPYKVRIMPNAAPRYGTTTETTPAQPGTSTTPTETAPETPTTTTETTPSAPSTTTEQPSAAAAEPNADSQTDVSSSATTSGYGSESGSSQMSEAQLHGQHTEFYNLSGGNREFAISLPADLHLQQLVPGGREVIVDNDGNPVVNTELGREVFENNGLLNPASREALEQAGYKVDYQRIGVPGQAQGQEVENYMSVITPVG